jgi:hypothetical protein
MSDPKPFASLSSGLLARKGTAKPAMRPQSMAGPMSPSLEDLGWNDMGYGSVAPHPRAAEEPREHVPSSIAALTPAPHGKDRIQDEEVPAEPVVVEQQRAIASSFAGETEAKPIIRVPSVEPAEVVQIPRRPRQAAGTKGKAAFTLRLDPQRHLKLRLACAIRHKSAQQIVSEALDSFLQTLPELETLAEQVPAKAKRN